MVKVVIAGGRDKWVSETEIETAILESGLEVSEIVFGGSCGVDECARQYGIKKGIKTTVFYADWDIHGYSAGPIRNGEMAKYSDALIAFRGGRGTSSMVSAMEKLRKPVFKV
jgi:hypothetical protein